jgi:hypothetical protein
MIDLIKIWEVIQVFPRCTALQKVTIVAGVPFILYFLYLVTIARPPLHQLLIELPRDYVAPTKKFPVTPQVSGQNVTAVMMVRNSGNVPAFGVRAVATDFYQVPDVGRTQCTLLRSENIKLEGSAAHTRQ